MEINYSEQLVQIEKKVSDNKIQKAKLTERLSQYQTEKQNLLNELKEYNLTEETLPAFIEKESEQIEKELAECRTILNIS